MFIRCGLWHAKLLLFLGKQNFLRVKSMFLIANSIYVSYWKIYVKKRPMSLYIGIFLILLHNY